MACTRDFHLLLSGTVTCHRCGYVFPDHFHINRTAECPECSAPVRVCKNCTFYEPGAHWDCRETIPEPVRDKERSNFCDYFRPAPAAKAGGLPSNENKGQARRAFDDLFS